MLYPYRIRWQNISNFKENFFFSLFCCFARQFLLHYHSRRAHITKHATHKCGETRTYKNNNPMCFFSTVVCQCLFICLLFYVSQYSVYHHSCCRHSCTEQNVEGQKKSEQHKKAQKEAGEEKKKRGNWKGKCGKKLVVINWEDDGKDMNFIFHEIEVTSLNCMQCIFH